MTPELQKKLRLQGLSKGGRIPFFQGRRKDVNGSHFTEHSCYICGDKFPCEMDVCNHAVYVRIGPCCDPKLREKKEAKW